jgi:hypothetical protein
MKKIILFCSLLVLILAGSAGCLYRVDEQQLVKIEAQLQTLSSALSATQQELIAAKKALSDAQTQTQTLQQQLQQAAAESAVAATATTTVPSTVVTYSEPYYTGPEAYYPYGHHRPYPYNPPVTPPAPPPPAPPCVTCYIPPAHPPPAPTFPIPASPAPFPVGVDKWYNPLYPWSRDY